MIMKNGFRFKKSMALLLACALALGAAGAVPALAASSQASNPIVTIVKDTSPAVVNIDVEAVSQRRVSPFPFGDDPIFRQFFGDAFKEYTRSVPMKGRGSGFIVTKDGQILTNNHVVEGADKITVTLADGKTYKARVLGKDPTFDLAVIKIEPKGDLPVLDLGDSDAVEVGEWVVAIGNPYGFEHSVTAGVISAKNRSIHAEDVNFDGLLQTDAAINPGNSGGPLLNMDGRVVGINAAIVPYAQGMGFAIPVNMAKAVMDDLVSYGKVKRGWLGVAVQKLTPEIARAYGVDAENGAIISDVFPDSAAAGPGPRRDGGAEDRPRRQEPHPEGDAEPAPRLGGRPLRQPGKLPAVERRSEGSGPRGGAPDERAPQGVPPRQGRGGAADRGRGPELRGAERRHPRGRPADPGERAQRRGPQRPEGRGDRRRQVRRPDGGAGRTDVHRLPEQRGLMARRWGFGS